MTDLKREEAESLPMNGGRGLETSDMINLDTLTNETCNDIYSLNNASNNLKEMERKI